MQMAVNTSTNTDVKNIKYQGPKIKLIHSNVWCAMHAYATHNTLIQTDIYLRNCKLDHTEQKQQLIST